MTAASLALLWIIITGRFGNMGAERTGTDPGSPPSAENVETKSLTLKLKAGTISNLPSKTALIEFSDFECPYCAKYATETLPRLKAEFVEKGKLEYVFMHFPLEQIHRNANLAARAAICAQHEGRFWPMHDQLFENQRKLQIEVLSRLATTLGLEEAKFRTCLETASNRLEYDQAEGRRLGVNSTPVFFIGNLKADGMIYIRRRIAGAYPYETFKNAIQDVDNRSAELVVDPGAPGASPVLQIR